MSEDDFDFVDDLFDAAALATLDKVEQQHVQNASQSVFNQKGTSLPSKSSQSRVLRPPPAKRLKTSEWTAIPVPAGELEEIEDEMPDIAVVVAKDGKYRTFDPVEGNPRTGSFATLPPRTTNQQSQVDPDLARRIVRPFPNKSGVRSDGAGYRPSQAILQQESIAASQSRFAAITAALKETTIRGENDEVSKLRAQIEKLKLDHEAALVALKEADEARLEREGEVETLRRNMTKSSVVYNEKLSKLQQEKSEEIEKGRQMERRLNQDLEKARTNFALRMQELETTVRKTPWSIRRPAPGQSNTGFLAPFDTPSRFVRREAPTPVPKTRREPTQATSRAVPAHSKAAKSFNGLVDSFNGGSPVKTQHRTQFPATDGDDRVKDRNGRLSLDQYFSPINIEAQAKAPGRVTSKSRDGVMALEFESFPDLGSYGGSLPLEMDAELGSELKDEDKIEDILLQDEDVVNLPDIREQCYAILFSHTSLPDYQLTLQRLFSLEITIPMDERDTYVNSCSSLMEAIGSRDSDFMPVVLRIANSLIRMARVLSRASSLVNLAAILELLSTMCLWLDSLTSLLLQDEEARCPMVLTMLVDIVTAHGLTSSDDLAEARDLAMRQSILLTEILCLTCPQEDIHQWVKALQGMEYFVRAPKVLFRLLNDKQPTWALCASMRLIRILSTYSECTVMLLSFPHTPGTRTTAGDLTRIPHIERISYLLVNSVTSNSEELQASIITVLTQLVLASPEAMATVAHSHSVVPALVATLDAYATLLWDDEPIESLNPGLCVKRNLELAVGILQLLHRIVFKMVSQLDLQRVIQFPPTRFNGLEHMFVVGLGRLGYADPPEWNEPSCKLLSETCAELARDLLEHIIDGPEVDTIWASYQDAGTTQDDRTQDEDELLDMPADEGDMNIMS